MPDTADYDHNTMIALCTLGIAFTAQWQCVSVNVLLLRDARVRSLCHMIGRLSCHTLIMHASISLLSRWLLFPNALTDNDNHKLETGFSHGVLMQLSVMFAITLQTSS